MDLNFAPPTEVSDLAQRVADFVKTRIVPYEKDPRWTPHGPTDELRIEKIKILNATKLVGPLDETTARGQYSGGRGAGLPRGAQGRIPRPAAQDRGRWCQGRPRLSG